MCKNGSEGIRSRSRGTVITRSCIHIFSSAIGICAPGFINVFCGPFTCAQDNLTTELCELAIKYWD